MSNVNLSTAKETKNDEFYTQLSDIQTELSNYSDKFIGKVVFCNCDDPFESSFVKYFLMNFNRLGLKELIATGYKTSPIIGEEVGENGVPYVLRVISTSKYLVGTQTDLDNRSAKYFLETESKNLMQPLMGNPALDDNGEQIKVDVKVTITDEHGKTKKRTEKRDLYYEAGDFRSDMCIELLKCSDIVVTNPPFSLFKEFILLLMKYNKQFITIGNLNAIQNKDFFPYILSGKIWLGATCFSGGATYFVGSKDLYDPEKMSNPKNAFIKNDKLYWRVNGVRWYTNIDHPALHRLIPIDLGYVYHGHEQMYVKYENYDAINVDKVSQIPCDYTGEMGVPVSFMDKYCVDQFDIVGIGIGKLGKDLGMTPMPKEIDDVLPGHSSVWRLYYMKDGKPVVPFQRIIIKFKDSYIKSHPEYFNKGD